MGLNSWTAHLLREQMIIQGLDTTKHTGREAKQEDGLKCCEWCQHYISKYLPESKGIRDLGSIHRPRAD